MSASVCGSDKATAKTQAGSGPASTAQSADATSELLAGPKLKGQPTWSETLRVILLTAIPDKFEDLNHWGRTTEVFDGVRVKQRGLNIRVSQKKRTVNHGAWHKYRVEFIDPKNTLRLTIDNIQPIAANQFQFDINFGAKLRCRADFEHWLLGVKGFNVTVVSIADVRITAHCQIHIRAVSSRKRIVPDLVIEPRVNSARLLLTNVDVERIGEIRGDIAEGIGDGSRRFIEKLMQGQEAQVVKKANEAIEKKQNSLRIPTSLLW